MDEKRPVGKPKGSPRPAGSGRKVGTLNKRTAFLRDLLEDHGFDFGKEFTSAFADLDKEARMQTLILLLPYCVPRLAQKEISEPVDVASESQPGIDNLSTERLLGLATEGEKP